MSFWEKGYNAVFITSFYRNPYMHSADDTIDKLNPKFLVKAARALVGMMDILANE
ncbi:MAG: hypothetical protein ABSE95_09525 [Thermodesulfobacteriota bacterium]|jgi:hypothetical protein